MAGSDDPVKLVARRADVLEALTSGSLYKRDLIDRLEVSRSTIDRAIQELLEAGLCERTSEGFQATVAGRLLLERYQSFLDAATATLDNIDVLEPLPLDAEVAVDVLEGADIYSVEERAPYRPLEPLHDTIGAATRYRALLPVLDDPRHVRLLYDHVVVDGHSAKLVADPGVIDQLRSEFPRRFDALADAPGVTILEGETPAFGLLFTGDDQDTTVSLIVYGTGQGVRAVLQNASEEAIGWAEQIFDRYHASAHEAPSSRRANGGSRLASAEPVGTAGMAASLATGLEAAGFVTVDSDYLADEPVADPITAWRAGLDLPEVHTNYAVERTRVVDGDRRSLTDELTVRLLDGDICAVVGPPGSGKSTVLKQVAIAWYRAGHGPVHYRRSGRGRTGVDGNLLVQAAKATPGRTLIVVEDAVRPDARGVFEAIRHLAGGNDAAVLIDAREHEWKQPPGEPLPPALDAARADHIDVVTIPPLSNHDAEALLKRVEETTGESIGLDPSDVLSDVKESSGAGDVLTLLHRAATYLDPTAGEATSLEANVRSVAEQLDSMNERALDDAVLVTLLHLLGIEVRPVDISGLFVGSPAAVLDVLEGRILFGDPAHDEPYRLPHEFWLVAFLASLVDLEGTSAAAERFGQCVTRLINRQLDPLEPSPDHQMPDRESIAGADGAGDPTGRIESVFALGLRYPKLAPLFGETGRTAIDLPEGTPPWVELQCAVWRGRMNLAWGDLDRADREFRQVLERLDRTRDRADLTALDPSGRVEGRPPIRIQALLGLAEVREASGGYEAAIELASEVLNASQDLDDQTAALTARNLLGRVHRETGALDAAEEQLDQAIEEARQTGRPSALCQALFDRGEVETYRREFEAAIEYKREAYDRAVEVGDDEQRNRIAGEIGVDHTHLNDLDAAEKWYRRALDGCRNRGDRVGANRQLRLLGNLELKRGEYEEAERVLETAIARSREIGHTPGTAEALDELAKVYFNADDYDAAAQPAQEALELYEEVGNPQGWISAKLTLVQIARRRDALDDAERHARAALERSEAVGDPGFELTSRRLLGGIMRQLGAHDEAAELIEESRSAAVEIGSAYSIAWADMERGKLARARGDHERASELFEAARDRFEDTGVWRDALEATEEFVDSLVDAEETAAALEEVRWGIERARRHGFEDERDSFEDLRAELADQLDA